MSSRAAQGRDVGSPPQLERGHRGKDKDGCLLNPIVVFPQLPASQSQTSSSEHRDVPLHGGSVWLHGAGGGEMAASDSGLHAQERRGEETNVARSR